MWSFRILFNERPDETTGSIHTKWRYWQSSLVKFFFVPKNNMQLIPVFFYFEFQLLLPLVTCVRFNWLPSNVWTFFVYSKENWNWIEICLWWWWCWSCVCASNSESKHRIIEYGEKEKTEDMTKNVGDIGDYRKKVQGVLKRSEK